MNIKIPNNIKVGGRIYEIEDNYKFQERTDRLGHSDHARNQIKITRDDGKGNRLADSNVEITFIHELIHCIDNVYNMNKLEEDVVDRLGEGLYQVLKDNNFLKP